MWSRWRSFTEKRAVSAEEKSVPRERVTQPTPLQIRLSEELKNEGNDLFKKGKYAAAAEKYTEAIAIRPNWAVALVNRANCYKKTGNWKLVERDCRVALGIDSQSMKANYFLGLALEEQQDHSNAVLHLEKSYELARDEEDQIMDEIWRNIARVSYAQWEREARQRREADRQLKSRLTTLLTEAHQHENQIHVTHSRHSLLAIQAKELELLEDLFRRAAAQDQPQELPSSLTCVLSMDVFRDPVVSPSGFSYEHSVLKEHLDRVGTFDPVTRQPLEKSQLVRNLNLRSVAHTFLKEHPWAWKESM